MKVVSDSLSCTVQPAEDSIIPLGMTSVGNSDFFIEINATFLFPRSSEDPEDITYYLEEGELKPVTRTMRFLVPSDWLICGCWSEQMSMILLQVGVPLDDGDLSSVIAKITVCAHQMLGEAQNVAVLPMRVNISCIIDESSGEPETETGDLTYTYHQD